MRGQRRLTLQAGLALSLAAAGFPSIANTGSERAKRLMIAYNDDYAPYSYVEKGRLKGILPELLQLLLAPLPNIQTAGVALPWRRVQAETQAGVVDAMCTFASEERKRFTDTHQVPVVTLKPHLFFAADNPLRKTIEGIARREELMKLRLIDLRGNNWAEENLREFPHVEYVPGHDDVFRMIMAGRGDAHVSLSPMVTKYRIRKIGLSSDQIISRPAPYVAAAVPFHLLVRKSHPRAREILAHLDRMLRRPGTARLIEHITRRHL